MGVRKLIEKMMEKEEWYNFTNINIISYLPLFLGDNSLYK
jgi:hypothetical protein